MLKKLFSIHYENDLIIQMLQGSKQGAIASNYIAPVIIIYVIYGYVPSVFLLSWFLIHVVLFISKLFLGTKLTASIEKNSPAIQILLILYIVPLILTASLYGLITFGAIYYETPDINIFIIGVLVITLSSGAVASLGTVFIAFLSYMFFIITPFIIALLYHGGNIFNTFAVILAIYMVINILTAYKLFLSFKNALTLDKKFKTIYNKSSDGIAIIINNKIVECNETVIKMFGYDNNMSDFLNLHLNSLMPEKQLDGTSSMRKMLLMLKKAEKNTITFDWLHCKKNGEKFWVEITLSPIELNRKIIIHGTWRDITDRKKVDEELKELNATLSQRVTQELAKNREKDRQILQQSRLAQMGEMISMIAHQWRQPLSAISATSHAINIKAQLNKLDKDTSIELSEKISEYSQHLSNTIDDFRAFFQSNKEKEETNFITLINSVLGIIEASIDTKNIKLIKDFDTLENFISYPNEIKQVILNLIKNAEDVLVERKIKQPYIKIKTSKTDSHLILQVSDNAGGISKEIINHIFDPYFSTKKQKDGTGLGLYMSKTIIEDHCNGNLYVSNTKDGTLFSIEIARGEKNT